MYYPHCYQVAEVLSPDKTRLSVHGWFHGPLVPRLERYREPAIALHPYINMEVRDNEWKLGKKIMFTFTFNFE